MHNLTIVSPITVGRASELAILHKAIDQLQSGNGQVILISGEAGVGKSRLVAETQAYAAGHDVAVFRGHCYPESISISYAPLIDLLHPFFASYAAAPFHAEFEPVARELLRLLPDIVPIIAEPKSVSIWDPEHKKRRLFASLSQFLRCRLRINPFSLTDAAFDAVISRVGLIYFPDQQIALTGMRRVLRPSGKKAAIVYSTPDKNQFFSIPVSIIRRRAQLPPPLPGRNDREGIRGARRPGRGRFRPQAGNRVGKCLAA